jgi:membrane-bound lytic murein transglycosylase F
MKKALFISDHDGLFFSFCIFIFYFLWMLAPNLVTMGYMRLINAIIFCASCLLISSCTQPQHSSSLSNILQAGVLKVGSIHGRTTYYNGSTSPEGFEYELAQGFADYLGVRLEVYPYYSYRELIPQLDNQRVDLIAANITMTEFRKNAYRFGPAYQSVNYELVYKKGNNRPRNIEQLDGDLTIVANDLYREPLTAYIQDDEAPFWQETAEKDIEELLEMVSNDELDYTLSDSNILAVARRRYPNLGIGFSVTDTLEIGWLLNKNTDDSLRAALIEYFGTMQTNGKLSALEDKYFGHVQSFDFVDTRAFMRAVTKRAIGTQRRNHQQVFAV